MPFKPIKTPQTVNSLKKVHPFVFPFEFIANPDDNLTVEFDLAGTREARIKVYKKGQRTMYDFFKLGSD